MNIIMAIIGLVGLKRAPERIKMHHFEGENAKNFLGRGHSPDPTPTGEGDTLGTRPSDHISGYGPVLHGYHLKNMRSLFENLYSSRAIDEKKRKKLNKININSTRTASAKFK